MEFSVSKSTDIWMPLYIGDYLSATQHLSTEQNGAYLLLLMSAWKFGGQLPDDDEQLSSITKLPLDRWIKTRQVICRFFEISGGVWTQSRLTAEIEKAIARKIVSSKNGTHGGRPKKPAGFLAGNPKHNLQESSSPSSLPSSSATQEHPWRDAPDFQTAWKAWEKSRKKKAGDRQFAALLKLSAGDLARAIAILNQSADNQWQGLFELKGGVRNDRASKTGREFAENLKL